MVYVFACHSAVIVWSCAVFKMVSAVITPLSSIQLTNVQPARVAVGSGPYAASKIRSFLTAPPVEVCQPLAFAIAPPFGSAVTVIVFAFHCATTVTSSALIQFLLASVYPIMLAIGAPFSSNNLVCVSFITKPVSV